MRRRIVVSVVIPTYNYGRFIAEAVESVRRQTHREVEIIVVDDGSTDDTQAVLASIRDERLIVIRTENRGISAARNTGLDRATGEYIAFLDADDRWLPEKLARQVAIMEAEPTVCAVFTNFRRFNAERVFRDDQFVFFPELAHTPTVPTRGSDGRRVTASAFVEFMRFGEFPTWVQATMFRASAMKDLRFAHAQAPDGHLLFSEDAHFCFRVFRRGEVAYISEPLLEVRRHESNITKRTLDLEARRLVLAKLKLETLRRLAAEPLAAEERAALRHRTGRALVDVGRIYVEHGLHLKALRTYLSAFRHGARLQALRQFVFMAGAVRRAE